MQFEELDPSGSIWDPVSNLMAKSRFHPPAALQKVRVPKESKVSFFFSFYDPYSFLSPFLRF